MSRTQINLGGAEVTDITPLRNLLNLQTLNLEDTSVRDITPLRNLTSLHALDISYTEISDISIFKHTRSLNFFHAFGCPIPYIPTEIFNQNNCAIDLFAYWRDLEQSQAMKNQQLKIMFLGNGCVGKTTLLHWFLDNKYKEISIEDGRTQGIIIQPYPFKDSDVLANFWDFGGQEVYHATHRLFLGRRSLYLLVWAAESPEAPHEERHPPQYWLDMIADIGDNERSRVLILQNLFGGQTERNILTDTEREEYEKRGLDITTYCVNLKTGAKIKALKAAIEDEAELMLQKNIEELPTSWVDIRMAVADMRLSKVKTLTISDFENICRDCKLATDPSIVLGYLHRAGELFHYSNQFGNQIILDQEWALKAIYAILKRERIERFNGIFALDDLKDFWRNDNPNLTDDEADIFLNFMLENKTMFHEDEDFHERGDNPKFVVPQLLPFTKPNRYKTWQRIPDKNCHRIEYAFLHRDIIERFIVAAAYLSKNNEYWRNGLFIEYENDEAMIEVVKDEKDEKVKYIHIECTGPTQQKLVQTIREEFNKIRTLDKAKEYRLVHDKWEQIAGEIISRAENMSGFKEKTPIFAQLENNGLISLLTTENNMKQYLFNLIADGKLKDAIDLMRQIGNTQSGYFRNDLVSLSGCYVRNENEKGKTISVENYRMEYNLIETAVKHVLESEFDESKAPPPPITEPSPNSKPEKLSNNHANKPKVYFSYAWTDKDEKKAGENREQIVSDLYQSLKAEGYDVRRDKENVGYKQSISEFMKEIGGADFIVVAISKKYLESANCMYEILQIYRKSNSDLDQLKAKIYPIVLEGTKIYNPLDRLKYVKFWKDQKETLEKEINEIGLAETIAIIGNDYKNYKEINDNIGLSA